jgi:PGF-pre-PGF domain-containing protein
MKTSFIKIEMKGLKVFLILVSFVLISSVLSSSAFAYPVWSENTTTPSSPQNYSPTATYNFSIRWNETVGGLGNISQAIFEWGGTNYTKSTTPAVQNNTNGYFWINFTAQAAGNYSFKWYANDTAGNWNSSDTWSYVINKGTPTVNVYIDDVASDKTITYPDIATVKGNETNPGDSDMTYTLWRNETSLGTGSSVSNSTRLGNATYIIKYNVTSGANWTSNSNSLTLKVLKGSVQPTLSINTTWTETYPTPTSTSCSVASVNNEVSCLLWRDGISKTSPEEILLGAGTYTYKTNTSETANYTTNDTGESKVLTISKGPTLTKLYLNGTEGNVSYNLTQVANFTVTLNVTGKYVNLTTSITGWTDQTGQTPLMNYTTLNEKGVFNITGYFLGDENYTASSQTWYATVADVLSPKWSNQAQNTSTPLVGAAISLSTYWADNYGLSFAVLATNETGSWENKTANYSSPTSLTGTGNWSNFTWQNSSVTKGTVVGWRIYANDTSNNWNVTDIMTFTVKAADGTSCTASNECIGGYCVHGICRSSSTYCGDTYCDSGEDCSSCSADCGTCPAVSPTPPWVLHSWDKILPGAAVSMNITKTGLDFSQIEIKVKNQANEVSIKVEKLAGQPAEVTHTVVGKAYQWIKITPANLNETNIETAKIRFKVNQSWISDNNVDPATVALNRWESDHWSKLPTTKLSEDTTYVYYESQTPGFSVFAITGETVSPVTTTTTTTTTIPTTTTTTTLPPTTTTIPPEGKPSWAPVIVIIIIIGIVLGYLYWLKRYRPSTWFKLKKRV